MEIKFHPQVHRDLAEVLRYYHEVSDQLEDEFDEEVRFVIGQVSINPLRFHLADRGFRRANLRRFPYHILYEVRSEILIVMHIRHNKRHPDYGKQRKWD